MTDPTTPTLPTGRPSVSDIEELCGRLRSLHQALHRPLEYPHDNQRLQIALAHADAMIFKLGIEAPGGWRTMDSAPFDGTEVLALGLQFDKGPGTFVVIAKMSDERWIDAVDETVIHPPIRWMPIPSADGVAPVGSAPPSNEGGSMNPSSPPLSAGEKT